MVGHLYGTKAFRFCLSPSPSPHRIGLAHMVLLRFLAPVIEHARARVLPWIGLAALALQTLSPAPTHAQTSPAGDAGEADPGSVPSSGTGETAEEDAPAPEHAAEYDRLILSALSAFKAGEWVRARGLFERAHALHPTARTLRTIGMSAFNQGDLVGAVKALEASLNDDRKPLTVEQQEHVRQLIHRADGRLGRLRLLVQPQGADIQVDGKAPDFVGGDQLVLEPGRHEISIQAPGFRTAVQHVRVSARDRATLEVQLQPGRDDEEPKDEVAVNAAGSLTFESRGDSAGQSNLAPWIAVGVGAAALVAGGVIGAVAYGKRKDLDEHCPGRACEEPFHSDVDSYNTLRTMSFVAGAVGIVGLGLGATLLVLDGDRDTETARAELRGAIGFGAIELRGRL